MTHLETMDYLKRTKPEMFEMVDNDPVLQEIDRKAKKPTCPNRARKESWHLRNKEDGPRNGTWIFELADEVWFEEWQSREFLFKNKSVILEHLKRELESLKPWERELLLDRVCKHKFKDLAKRFHKNPRYLGRRYKYLLEKLKYRIRELMK